MDSKTVLPWLLLLALAIWRVYAVESSPAAARLEFDRVVHAIGL
jgi:hypothetical protein